MELISAELRAILPELSPERRRLFACDCAEHVLPVFARCYPDDQRPHNAIQVARAFAHGGASPAELAGAWNEADTAAWATAIEEDNRPEFEAAPSVAVTTAGCCGADFDVEAGMGIIEMAIEAVVIAAVGGAAANTIWQNNEHLLDTATVERYRRAEAAERRWQYQRILQYRATEP